MSANNNAYIVTAKPFSLDNAYKQQIKSLFKGVITEANIISFIKEIESAVELNSKFKNEQSALLSKKEAKVRLNQVIKALEKAQKFLGELGTGITPLQAKQILKIKPDADIQPFTPDAIIDQYVIENSSGTDSISSINKLLEQKIQLLKEARNDIINLPNKPKNAIKLMLADQLIELYNKYTGNELWLSIDSKCEELFYIVFNSISNEEVIDLGRTIQNIKDYMPLYTGTHMKVVPW